MDETPKSVAELLQTLDRAKQELSKVIIGQEEVIKHCLIAIFTAQHALIEGVPGVGKTLLVRSLAQCLHCDFNRIQFTPDLMPTDITGTNVYSMKSSEFTLVKGPVFTTFLLADEINRAPAKTQAALLQAMQERQVTIDRETHTLSPHFTVFATQNPIEYEGTYPLPEAQKDRFMMKIEMDTPVREDELVLAQRILGNDSPEAVLDRGDIQPVIRLEELTPLRQALQTITVKEELVAYVVDVIRGTREADTVLVGGGPRATQCLLWASRAAAAMAGRDFVTPDDVKDMAVPVLLHRLVLRPEYEIEGVTVREVITKLMQEVAVPR